VNQIYKNWNSHGNSHPFFDFADFFAKPGAQEDAEQAIREMQATAWGPRGNLISGTPHG
jgi:hypothetical protein